MFKAAGAPRSMREIYILILWGLKSGQRPSRAFLGVHEPEIASIMSGAPHDVLQSDVYHHRVLPRYLCGCKGNFPTELKDARSSSV